MLQKFYLIELSYVGPNQPKGPLGQRIRVRQEPGRKNMSGELCSEGWLGTTDDWDKTAIGEFDEHGTREKLKEYDIQLPNTSRPRCTDYSHSHEHSEWWNKRNSY